MWPRGALAAAVGAALAHALPGNHLDAGLLAEWAAAVNFGRAPAAAFPLPFRGSEGPSAPGLGVHGRQVLPQWSADIEYDGTLAGMHFMNGSGTMHYDRPGKRRRITYVAMTDYFRPSNPNEIDEIQIALPDGLAASNLTAGGLDDDLSVCEPNIGILPGMKYEDMFAWLLGASWAGSKVVQGERCDVFTRSATTPFRTEFWACVGEDGLPREMNQSVDMPVFGGYSWYRFSNFRVGRPEKDAFRPSKACSEHYPRPACKDAGVLTLDVYRIFGPQEPPSLDSRNTGDILGDLAFVCTQGSGRSYEGKVIAHWRVNVSRAFGQYALCNYDGRENRCEGPASMLRSVGRRSGQFQGIGPSKGQCSPNDDVGSQYSFPSQAKCPPGVEPGGSCAWADPVPLRTVEASCVMTDRGLLEACAREVGHAPFARSAEIFAAALASSDPALGGCPDARPASAATIIV